MIRKQILIALVSGLPVLIGAVGCGDAGSASSPTTTPAPAPPPPPTPSFTLSGTVSDSRRTGLVLPGAVVQFANGRRESTTTGPDGQYRFLNVSGTVTVTVAVEPAYVGQEVEVMVDADRALDFALEHTGTPPFEDAPWITPDILGPSDPSSLRSVTYAGRGMRWVWDDRPEDFVTINAYLFDVQFAEQVVEFVMNPEFGSREAARAHVDTFTPAMGRLPNLLLSGLREVWINAVLGRLRRQQYLWEPPPAYASAARCRGRNPFLGSAAPMASPAGLSVPPTAQDRAARQGTPTSGQFSRWGPAPRPAGPRQTKTTIVEMTPVSARTPNSQDRAASQGTPARRSA